MNGKQITDKGGLLVVSGPSGSGKTTICRRLAEHDKIELAVSATTRARRPGEIEGKHYFFLTREDFEARIRNNEFVEFNEVFKDTALYGSLRKEVERGLNKQDCYYLMEIDVVGALNLKKDNYRGGYIFIAPPSLEALE
ncbi:MAG: AAA family ATPase, partial [Planctomycetota bacterium]